MVKKRTRAAEPHSNRDAQQQEPTRFPPTTQIEARVVFGQVTYFALTHNQIETYTALGWLVTAFVTLVSVSLEAAFGCWLALTQGGMSSANSAIVTTSMWVAVAIGLTMGICTIIFCCLKAKNKRGWLTNTVQVEQEA